jgi:hypothetical protein
VRWPRLERLGRRLARRVPPERADYARALLAELEEAETRRRAIAWLAGLLRLLPGWRALAAAGRGAAILALAVAVGWFDLLNDDATGMSLLALLAASAAGGLLARRPWAAGVVVGGSVAAAHLLVPHGMSDPHTTGGALALSVLVVPAVGAATLAGRLRPAS